MQSVFSSDGPVLHNSSSKPINSPFPICVCGGGQGREENRKTPILKPITAVLRGEMG